MENVAFIEMSFSESESNINNIRKYAKTKELSLRKVRNKNLWDVVELQTGRFLLKEGSLEDAYCLIDQYVY